VLSGCRTAGGVLVEGEGVQGLTAPLIQAGARCVVASQWRIADRGTVPFIQAFYQALSTGLPVGDALRQAKLDALHQALRRENGQRSPRWGTPWWEWCYASRHRRSGAPSRCWRRSPPAPPASSIRAGEEMLPRSGLFRVPRRHDLTADNGCIARRRPRRAGHLTQVHALSVRLAGGVAANHRSVRPAGLISARDLPRLPIQPLQVGVAMYLVELKPGKEEAFQSVEELAAAIRRDEINSQSRIFHRASSKWISITLHPIYKQVFPS
jgi:hypothetical protein